MKDRLSLLFSLLALTVSGITLFKTFLEQPDLRIYPACSWQYGRGPAAADEFLIVPVTIANEGAQSGVALELSLDVLSPAKKHFTSSFTTLSLDDKNRQLFAPISVEGRRAFTSSVVFTAAPRTLPAFEAPGTAQIRISIVSAQPLFWRAASVATRASQAQDVTATLRNFDLAGLVSGGRREIVETCAN